MNATYQHKYPIGSKIVFLNTPKLDKNLVGKVVTVKSLHRYKIQGVLCNFYGIEEDTKYCWNEDLFKLVSKPINIDENEFVLLFRKVGN